MSTSPSAPTRRRSPNSGRSRQVESASRPPIPSRSAPSTAGNRPGPGPPPSTTMRSASACQRRKAPSTANAMANCLLLQRRQLLEGLLIFLEEFVHELREIGRTHEPIRLLVFLEVVRLPLLAPRDPAERLLQIRHHIGRDALRPGDAAELRDDVVDALLLQRGHVFEVGQSLGWSDP